MTNPTAGGQVPYDACNCGMIGDARKNAFEEILTRKFACYAGIVPYKYSSGTSVKDKTKVHHCANKYIKSLIRMAVMASI